MSAWDQSTIECTDCDGRAVAKTDQWGRVSHYECLDCGCTIEPEAVK